MKPTLFVIPSEARNLSRRRAHLRVRSFAESTPHRAFALVRGLRMTENLSKVAVAIIKRVCKAVRCPKGMAVAVVFVGDAKMRELNHRYRGKDSTTNVLAFEGGDIFISLPEAKREAKKYGWTLKYEVARLALHGFLHVLGYDHVKNSEARKMDKIEKKILKHYA